MRQNQLIGYGLVVGLNGTGDTLNNIPFTKQSLQAMLERLGVNVRGQTMRTGNVAAAEMLAQQRQADRLQPGGLGGQQFRLVRTLGQEAGEHLAHHAQGLAGLLLAGLQADLERPGLQKRQEAAIHAVGETALLAHFAHQARNEAASAQRVVADLQREKVRIAALQRGQADQHVGLRRRMGQTLFRPRGQAGRPGRRTAAAGRQARRQLLDQGFGLAAPDVADDGDHCAAGAIMPLVEAFEVVAREVGAAGEIANVAKGALSGDALAGF